LFLAGVVDLPGMDCRLKRTPQNSLQSGTFFRID
jgi:hypothetical protein